MKVSSTGRTSRRFPRIQILATLAAASLGAVATQFICPIDDPAHHLVSHFLPVLLLSGVGALAGRRWLDRLRTVYSTA